MKHSAVRVFLLSVVVACGASSPPATVPAPVQPPTVVEPTQPPVVAEPRTPLDPQIRSGKLRNGLTYYVMQHKKPEQRASLWLAVNAGSVLEDPDQRGLAHFVEHLAFNGTRRFAKQAIVNFIEKVGMRFGADVNAYTSFDETVYMLTVPTDDRPTMLTGLDILRDWAGDISFDPEELEKERGVVLEEWRLGRGAFSRINDKQWPVMFQGAKYAERLPIGLPEIIKTAPRDAFIRFYKDWYRPENMAVIAVGDFDPEAMEKEIASRFGGLVPAAKPRVRTPIPVPHTHPTAVTIATDAEMPFTRVQIIDKLDHRPEATRSDYRLFLVEGLYHDMMRARFTELGLDPAAPFTFAGSSTSSLTRTADGFTRFANAKQGRVAEALTVLVREFARVAQHGFNQSELDRVREAQLADAKSSAAEWDKTPSEEIADEMTRNFFEDEQMPGRPVELRLNQELLPTVTLAELNQLASTWGGAQGRVIALSGPASAKLPTEAEVRSLFATASTAKVEPWRDVAPPPLMTTRPTAGKVVKTTTDVGADATVWTLANGIRVIVKPTQFQNDAIEVQGWQPGGSSLVPDVVHARFATDVVASGGVASLDPVTLNKALSGKLARVRVSMSELSENASLSTRPSDLETGLQLLHLRLTSPRRDEGAFAVWRDSQLEWARNRRLLPEVSFYEDMEAVESKNHPRRRPTTPEMLAKVELAKAHAVFAQRFGDLGAFTFVIVGNVDLATLQPLVETYLGSLPSKGRKARWKDVGITYATGKVTKNIVAGTEPKSYVSMTFAAPDRWSRDASDDATVLSMVLRIRLREVLREDLGGVYGVRSWVSLSRQPKPRREATISFGCDPANVDKLRAAAIAVVREIQKDGVSADNLAKVTEQLKRAHETDMKENWWWGSRLRSAYWYGDDFATANDLSAVLARATSDRVRAAARRFFNDKHVVTGVLRPMPSAAPVTPAATPATNN